MDVFWDIIKERTAFILLSVIAQRTSRRGNPIKDIGPGQALIGDYKVYGMTEQEYRTAKDKLVKWGFINVTGTNLGTVATLLPNDIYDINAEPVLGIATDKQRASNEQATTIKNDNKVKKEKKQTKPVRSTEPSTDEVKEFFTSKGSTVSEAEAFFEYFSLADWHDSKGKKMLYWRRNAAGWIKRNKPTTPKEVKKCDTTGDNPGLYMTDEYLAAQKAKGSAYLAAHPFDPDWNKS